MRLYKVLHMAIQACTYYMQHFALSSATQQRILVSGFLLKSSTVARILIEFQEFRNYCELISTLTSNFIMSFLPKSSVTLLMKMVEGQEWMEKVKSGGAVPLKPDNCPSGWSSPHGDIFMVRGAEYFKTKTKIPAGDYLLKPLGFDWIKGAAKISDLLNNPKARVRRALDDESTKNRNKPFVWAFNFQLPTKENHSIVAYFVGPDPNHDHPLISQFLKGDDGFKSSRLKLIANVVKGPWIVKKAVGEQAICVIGRVLTCRYPMGVDFVEVDIDVGSSMVAKAIVHLAFGYLTTLTVDLAFLIESQSEAELPERILGAIRFSELDIDAATTIELPCEGGAGNVQQTSLPTRFWKSFGKGFSHLVHPGSEKNECDSKDAEKA